MAGFFSNDASAQRWQRTRQRGRQSFILKFGILGWGIPMALAVTILDWVNGIPPTDLAVPLAIRLVLFGLVGGLAFGGAMWKFNEWMYGRNQKTAS